MNGRALALLPLAASLAAAAAGCGGGSGSPGVAQIGATTSATTTTTGSGSQPSATDKFSSALAFSRCMRRNGVPRFPDPTQGGGLHLSTGDGLNPGSPQFQAAQSKCQSLLPNGGRPTQAQIAKLEASALAFSRCMRSHGLPNFPDPQFDTSHGGFGVRIGSKAGGLDPNSPVFQAAEQACQKNLPGRGPRGLGRGTIVGGTGGTGK